MIFMIGDDAWYSEEGPRDEADRVVLGSMMITYLIDVLADRSLAGGLGVILKATVRNWFSLGGRDTGETE